MKKFELTTETKIRFGRTLYRIKALKSFGGVCAGDLGGWVEKEKNLSHDGNAWVSGDARVSGNAWISDNARVSGDAWVFGIARVSDDAVVFSNTRVYDYASIYGNAKVHGNANISGNARVYGDANVYGDASIYGNIDLSGDADVSRDAQIFNYEHVMWISRIGSRNGTTTFFATKTGIFVNCGCFSGSLEAFAAAVDKNHGDSEHGKAYRLAIEIAKLRIKLPEEE